MPTEAGRIFERLCSVGGGPVARLVISGKGAAGGIVLRLQRRDVRIKRCERREKFIWRRRASTIDAASRLERELVGSRMDG